MASGDRVDNSRRRTLAYLGTIIGAAFSGCVSEDTGSEVSESHSASASGPELLWSFETDGDVWVPPVVSDGVLYFGSNDGYVYALQENENVSTEGYSEWNGFPDNNSPNTWGPTGEVAERWRFSTDGIVTASPVVVDGSVYVGSFDGRFYSISAETGRENWRMSVGGAVGTSASVKDGMVYVGYGNSNASALSVPTGRSGGVHAVSAENEELVWSVERDQGVQSSPIISNDLVHHGCQDGKVYALDKETGEEVWEFGADNDFCGGDSVVDDGVLYIGCEDYSMYAIDSDNGSLIWEFETDGKIISSPIVENGKVYFGSNDSHLYAVDKHTGKLEWKFRAGENIISSAALSDGVLYFGSRDGKVYAVDRMSGSEVWNYKTGGMVLSTPVVADGVVYVGSSDGKLYAIDGHT